MIKVNNKIVKLDRFPDGTLNIKCNECIRDNIVVISWHYHDDAEFMALAFITKHYQAYGNNVILYMPYVPNARMDRTENTGDVFTLKYFGEMINSLNFSKVFIVDAHSSVAIASIKNCYFGDNGIMTDAVIKEIENIEGEIPIVFFPDEGAMKRYSKKLNIPFAFGMKKRDWSSGKILGLDVLGITPDEIKGKNVLIRDDICSKGGTFYYSAKRLKELGAANIYLMATHCENNIHSGEFGEDKVNLLNTGLIKHVFTTNSTYSLGNSDMITVVDTEVCIDYEKCRFGIKLSGLDTINKEYKA